MNHPVVIVDDSEETLENGETIKDLRAVYGPNVFLVDLATQKKILAEAYVLEKNHRYELKTIVRTLPQVIVPNAASFTVLHHYHCRLLYARRLKCFRANVYKIAEENLAFIREGFGDGIKTKCDSFDIDLDLVFKEESWMLRFQSALFRIAGNTTSNKKPRIAVELESKDDGESVDNEDDEDQDEDNDQKRVNNFEIEIHDQRLSCVSLVPTIKRVFYFDYLHDRDTGESPNSPQCDTFSDAGSMSIYEPETVTVSIERVGQMIENYNNSFFNGKKPEIAHIKDKAKSNPVEKKDENNYLYLSRFLHEAFDGINTEPSNFPWFLIRYISHQEESIDHGGLQRLFGNDLMVYDRTKRYHCTVVHIEFYNSTQVDVYSQYLRDGCQRVDTLKFQLELYFSDPVKAKKYLDWKEARTLRKWGKDHWKQNTGK